jgi:hypothetical protein
VLTDHHLPRTNPARFVVSMCSQRWRTTRLAAALALPPGSGRGSNPLKAVQEPMPGPFLSLHL